MEESLYTSSNATQGDTIEAVSPQAAESAADVPASAPSGEFAEEVSSDVSSERATPPEGQEDVPTPDAVEIATEGVYLPVYNGKTIPIRMDDTERVTALLRQGLRFEKFLPQFEALRRISLASGFHKPEELVDRLCQAAEEREYRELLDASGGNEALARETLELRKKERERQYADVKKSDEQGDDRSDLTARLAKEYCELKDAVPQTPAFSLLPPSVVQEAAASGRSLLQCYLLFERQEQALREEAQRKAQEAAKASSGSLKGISENISLETGDTFRRAFQNWL